MNLPQNIVLLGFMGSGKSTTGKELSVLTGFEHWDMDQWIEDKNEKPVSEIFEKMGEEYFRAEELKALAWIRAQTRYISSLGGGAWLSGDSREILLKLGWCVWLKVSPEQCYKRIGSHLAKRPLLAKSEKPLDLINQLLEKRNPAYSQAHFSIDTDNKTPKDVAMELYKISLEVKPFDLP